MLKERHHSKRLIIYEEMNFDAISKEYISENTLVLPRYIDEKRWRSFWPIDKKLHTIKRWWFNWNRLNIKVSNLSELHMIEQFDLIMIKHFEDLMKKLFELEMQGETFTLMQRWTYISDKVGALEYVNLCKHESLYTNPTYCFTCGKLGHIQRECPSHKVQGKPSGYKASGIDKNIKMGRRDSPYLTDMDDYIDQ